MKGDDGAFVFKYGFPSIAQAEKGSDRIMTTDPALGPTLGY